MRTHTSLAMRPITALAFLALAAPAAGAQQEVQATPVSQSSSTRPPVRALGAVTARSTEAFASVLGVRALPGGRVLVNDPQGRRVVLLDASLATATVVADSTSATANAYGGRFGGLLAYRGDSSLFVDPASLSMLVIDPAGRVARVMSVPRSQDVIAIAGVASGTPGFDAAGRLVYRVVPRPAMPPMGPGGHMTTPPQMPDSAALVRIDLASRSIDTIARLKVQAPRMQVIQEGEGRIRMQGEINPLPVVDDWAVLADGSIALVRGRDYRVEFLRPDGTRTAAVKIPFEWQRLTDEDKVAFIDSVKAARERQAAAGGVGAGAGVPIVQQTITQGGPGGAVIRGGEGGRRGEATAGQMVIASGPGGPGAAALSFVPPSELPDYKPPFLPNSTRADGAGNLWVRTIPTRQLPGGPVYDVIDAHGQLVDRVQLPEGRQLVGFADDGSLFLVAREAGKATLERARLR